MKIVVNARFLSQPIVGTQRFAIELLRGLQQHIPELIFLSPDNIVHHNIAEEFNTKIIGNFKKGILWEQLELPMYLRRNGNPLLINLSNMAPLFYSNNIVTVLDLSFYTHPEWFSSKFSIFFNFMTPRLASKARKVITISEYSRQDIISHYGISPDNVKIVYPNISKIFLESNKVYKKNQYGKYILAVSSLDPRKNFPSLIKAFIQADFPDTKLVIVGSEHKVFSNNNLRKLAEGKSNIIFTGYVSDEELVILYKNASLFAYPSFFEGFGIPPLEAMACGCPTLVSSVTSLPEVCGDASIYVDPYDVSSIKNGLIMALSNSSLRNDLITKGYERVKLFNIDSSALQMASIVNELL